MPGTPAENVASLLRTAILSIRLYPPSSPIVLEASEAVYQGLQACLKEMPTLAFNDLDGKLLVNLDTPLPKNELHPFFKQHDVQTVTFNRGLSVEELTVLIRGFAKRKEEFPDGQRLIAWLPTQGVTHIKVEEFQFVAVRKGEDVARQIRLLFTQQYDKFSAVLSSLEKSMDLLESLEDEGERQGVRDMVVQQIVNLSPAMLREFMESPLSDSVEKAGLRPLVLQAPPREKIEQVLAETDTWYDAIEESASSEEEIKQKKSDLRKFIEHLAQTPAGQTIPGAVYENLRALKESGDAKPKEVTVEATFENLMKRPSAALLEPPFRQKCPEVFKTLCGLKAEESAMQFVRKVAENLGAYDTSTREQAVRMLRSFQDLLLASRLPAPAEWLLAVIGERLEVEKQPMVYAELVQFLETAAKDALVNQRFEICVTILGRLRRHIHEDPAGRPFKKQVALKTLQDFAQNAVEILCADMVSGVPERQQGATQALVELGEECVPSLLEVVRRAADPRIRQFALEGLRHFLPKTREAIGSLLDVRSPADVLLKALPLYARFAYAGFTPVLVALLDHPDAAVRRDVVEALAATQEMPSDPVIARWLADPDSRVLIRAVQLLRELHAVKAAPELIKKVPSSPPAVQEEICLTLGSLKDPKAIACLIDCLGLSGGFWRRPKKISEAVRVRAAWALGQYLPDPKVEKILRSALRDRSRLVQTTAQSALAKSPKK